MKTFLSAFLFSILTFATFSAHSVTLVVSDIDDTIKVSHVLSTLDSAWNLPRVRNEFYGMAALMTALSEDATYYPNYLTNAPEIIGGFHKRFLNINSFPEGRLLLRSGSSDTHKLRELRKMRDQTKPDRFVLIGDNGERDVLFYDTFTKETKGIEIHTFIRYLYSPLNKDETGKKVRAGQVGFVTMIDLTLALFDAGQLSLGQTDQLIRTYLPKYLTARIDEEEPIHEEGGPIAYPKWMDCRGFKWTAKPLWLEQWPQLAAYQTKITAKCSKAPKASEWLFQRMAGKLNI